MKLYVLVCVFSICYCHALRLTRESERIAEDIDQLQDSTNLQVPEVALRSLSLDKPKTVEPQKSLVSSVLKFSNRYSSKNHALDKVISKLVTVGSGFYKHVLVRAGHDESKAESYANKMKKSLLNLKKSPIPMLSILFMIKLSELTHTLNYWRTVGLGTSLTNVAAVLATLTEITLMTIIIGLEISSKFLYLTMPADIVNKFLLYFFEGKTLQSAMLDLNGEFGMKNAFILKAIKKGFNTKERTVVTERSFILEEDEMPSWSSEELAQVRSLVSPEATKESLLLLPNALGNIVNKLVTKVAELFTKRS